jgi:hypothetical protein
VEKPSFVYSTFIHTTPEVGGSHRPGLHRALLGPGLRD